MLFVHVSTTCAIRCKCLAGPPGNQLFHMLCKKFVFFPQYQLCMLNPMIYFQCIHMSNLSAPMAIKWQQRRELHAPCVHCAKFRYICVCFFPASKLKGPLLNGHPRLVQWLGSVNGRSAKLPNPLKLIFLVRTGRR